MGYAHSLDSYAASVIYISHKSPQHFVVFGHIYLGLILGDESKSWWWWLTRDQYRTYWKIRITKCSKDTFNDSYPPVMVSLRIFGTSTRYHTMTPPTNIWVCTSARRLTRTKQGPFWFVITYMARCTSKSSSFHGEDSCDVRCSVEQLTHE